MFRRVLVLLHLGCRPGVQRLKQRRADRAVLRRLQHDGDGCRCFTSLAHDAADELIDVLLHLRCFEADLDDREITLKLHQVVVQGGVRQVVIEHLLVDRQQLVASVADEGPQIALREADSVLTPGNRHADLERHGVPERLWRLPPVLVPSFVHGIPDVLQAQVSDFRLHTIRAQSESVLDRRAVFTHLPTQVTSKASF